MPAPSPRDLKTPQNASVRFYAELNDFLPPSSRFRETLVEFFVPPTVKDAIESRGVPHVEVDMILVNGESVGFDHRLTCGDRIAVYPVFESLDITPILHLRPEPLRRTAFVADVHLRKLARTLRLLGFDTAWTPHAADADLVQISRTQHRILLTRDRQLLKRGALTHGVWIRATDPVLQAEEVIRRFDLESQLNAFTRCMDCNERLLVADKASVLERIPPKTAAWLDEYLECGGCHKLYWRGTHMKHLQEMVDRFLRPRDRS